MLETRAVARPVCRVPMAAPPHGRNILHPSPLPDPSDTGGLDDWHGSRLPGSAPTRAPQPTPCGFLRWRHSRAMRPLVLIAFLLLPVSLRAQPMTLDAGALRNAALIPFLERGAYLDLLTEIVEGFTPNPVLRVPGLADDDIYFWSVSGRFGADLAGSTVPGGILTCARYGLETRDRLAAARLSDRAAFGVMRQALILSDDRAAWPEGAVARLACALTWDDGRRVAPMAEAELRAALDGFETVESRPDPNAEARVRVFGPGGYRIVARDGPADAVVVLDAIWVDQLATHQQFRFRSFLMGGGS